MDVKVGQVWQDNDPRHDYKRRVSVLEIKGAHALVQNIHTKRKTRISLDRFRKTSTGYILVEDVKPQESKCPSCDQPRGDEVECPSCHKLKLTCCGIAGKHVRCFECEETVEA